MTRDNAMNRARALFDSGEFFRRLAPLVAEDTGSDTGPDMRSGKDDRKRRMIAYLDRHMVPWLDRMGFACRILENPADPRAPFMIAKRVEGSGLPSILLYGHSDTVPPMAERWDEGLDPLTLTSKNKQWYGRGTADNKGQHAINLAALECVLEAKEALGFNVTLLLETGEEIRSPGLHKLCAQEKEALKADVLIASDGPRLSPEIPTVFGGARGAFNFDLEINLRQAGCHSGNWGGLLANPGIILSHAIASMVGPKGEILIDALRPDAIPEDIKAAVGRLAVAEADGPGIDTQWGEPGLSAAEKVYAWNTLDVLALECGDTARPVNVIPPRAWARLHIRFIEGFDPSGFIPAIRNHLDQNGFSMVRIVQDPANHGLATRMAPDNPWVRFTMASMEKTLGRPVAFLPNIGGTLPNDAFNKVIGMDTIWIPHSYRGCCQHAPNEHIPESIIREGLVLMAGLFWDLGEPQNTGD